MPSERTHTKYPTIEAWQAEADKRFGTSAGEWKFECPSCGRVYSVREFAEAAGGDKSAAGQQAPQMCIGRVNGKGRDAFGEKGSNEHGCNYAAFGLFRLGDIVIGPNGKEISVNPFAEG